MAAVARFTTKLAARRKKVSCRCWRMPPTESAPASTAARSFPISSGGFCRSASRVTSTSPRARSMAAMSAMCCPAFEENSMTRTRPGYFAAISSRIVWLRSRLPSFEKMTSHVRPSFSSAGKSRSESRGRFPSSL